MKIEHKHKCEAENCNSRDTVSTSTSGQKPLMNPMRTNGSATNTPSRAVIVSAAITSALEVKATTSAGLKVGVVIACASLNTKWEITTTMKTMATTETTQECSPF